ncbi:hypothetical protein LB450_12450 [Psychroflexus sp. CAK1W]|uniref:hypothetical protein n=1 Tax=Psychroflexus curvus TaxID=2873595 RepID=UPI001CCCE24A|nr:hypothetical protein [Psychroflexus curvus]MBZ9628917.1 hypothetical protein [Psychroflexus curvus]
MNLKKENIFWVIVILTLLSTIRTFIIPLQADELTYFNISENILNGKYYQINNPSTVSPIIPFIISLFKIPGYPQLSIFLVKLFQILITIAGFRYLILILKKIEIDEKIKVILLCLTIVNPIGITYYSNLYPASVIFFAFWGIIYYCSSNSYSRITLIKILVMFVILSLTRYLYLLMWIPISFYVYNYVKHNKIEFYSFNFLKTFLIVIIPLMLWFKYVYNIESINESEISYFDRFKKDNFLVYSIKAGLGVIKHHEVSRINGLPAFASLFVPITGFRNFALSIILIVAFLFGFIFNKKKAMRSMFYSTILIMLGLILAGTGFSRYWVTMLPAYYLGFYLAYNKLKFKDKYFVYCSYLLCFIYIINEFRLNYLIINKYLLND